MWLFGWRRWRLARQARASGKSRRREAGRTARPELEVLENRLVPATLTWTGAVNNLWDGTQVSGTLTNWTSSDGRAVAIPQAGDDLVFPTGAANLASTNDLTDLSVASITFQGTGYTLGGNALTLTGPLSDQSASDSGGPGENSIQFGLTLSGTLPLAVTDANQTLSLTGAIGGTGGITKSGAGRVSLTQNNTYGGGTDISAGELSIQLDSSLGTGAVTVETGAALEIQANLGQNPFLNIPNQLVLNGSGVNGTGAVRNLQGFNTFLGDVTLQSDATVEVDVGQLGFSGQISGGHGFTKAGQMELDFSGSAPNTYTGPTVVDNGFMGLAKDPGVTAIAGDLVVGDGTGTTVDSDFGSVPTTVQLQNDNQIAPTSRVTVASDGLLDLNSFSNTLGSLAGVGQVNLFSTPDGESPASQPFGSTGPTATLTAGADGTSTTYGGVITGQGGTLVKIGGGTFTLSGANTFAGTIDVNGGTLLVDGTQPAIPVVVNGGATLGGHGTVGPTSVNAGATVSPGDSPGILSVQGGITFSPGSVFLAQLNSPAPGTGYDQLNVVGPVVLNNPTLRLVLGFTPAAGQDFVLLQNSGAGPIQGAFAGAPEDALLRHGNAFLDVSYATGNAVDVQALTRADLFVRALFADFGAVSTRATRAPYERQADSGVSRLALAREFLSSPARRQDEVNLIYAAFNQPPDSREARYVRQLLRGVPGGEVLIRFLDSRAFRAHHRSDRAFLRGLFTALLGHRPGRHDHLGNHPLSYYLGQLSSGAVTRDDLARRLLASDEVYAAAVLQDFRTFLGITPTSAQLQETAVQLISGALTPDTLAASLVAPDGYVDAFLARCSSGKEPGVVCVNV